MSVVFLTGSILPASTVAVSPSASSTHPVTRLSDGDRAARYQGSSAAETNVTVDAGKIVTCSGVALVNTTITPYVASVLSDSPTVYLRLGESSGTTAQDASGNNLDGEYQGSPYLGADGMLSVGAPATAVDFVTALAHYVDIASVPALTTSWAMEAIIKPRTIGTTMAIMSRSNDWHFRVTSTGLLLAEWQDSGATNRSLTASSGTLVAGTAYHVAFRHDGTTATLYVNGVSVGTTSSWDSGTPPTGQWRIGRRGGALEYFNGTIQEAAIYGTAPSAASILVHAQAMTGEGTKPRLYADIATSPATTLVTAVDVFSNGNAYEAFSATAARYWKFNFRAQDAVQDGGELVIGTARSVSNPAYGLEDADEGNVAVDEARAGYEWAAERGDERKQFTYHWDAMSDADVVLLRAAFADTHRGAKPFVFVDPDGVVRWMRFVDKRLPVRRHFANKNEVDLVLRESL